MNAELGRLWTVPLWCSTAGFLVEQSALSPHIFDEAGQ
ncbi:hypothetical protein CDS [Bradyrhizobium sp.]|nr:hypothetical protein CDS [Bradyrhizobium sp.]